MEYPSLVYKDGGNHKRPGGTYSYRAVNSDADLAAAKELGWFLSLSEVIKGSVDEKEQEKPKQKRAVKQKKPKQEEEPKQEAQNDQKLLGDNEPSPEVG